MPRERTVDLRKWPEVNAQLHAPAALPPKKERNVPTGQEVGRVPEPVRTTGKETHFAHTGN
jgi:hypothetical protein